MAISTKQVSEPLAKVICSMGRLHLLVAGIALATQGDKCRHGGFPEELLNPIPQEELETAWIGDKKACDLPIDVVRFFRGDCWNEAMLEYTASKINEHSKAIELVNQNQGGK